MMLVIWLSKKHSLYLAPTFTANPVHERASLKFAAMFVSYGNMVPSHGAAVAVAVVDYHTVSRSKSHSIRYAVYAVQVQGL